VTEAERTVVDWGKWIWYVNEIKRMTGKTMKIEVERKGFDDKNQHIHNEVCDFWFTLDGEHLDRLFNCNFDTMEIFLLGMKRMAEALSE